MEPLILPEGDAWRLTVEGDFTTPEAVGRLIWPALPHIPPGVSIKPMFLSLVKVEVPRPGQKRRPPKEQQAFFELTGVRLFTVSTMDPLFAKMFANLGLVEESQSVQEARAAFRARHHGHGEQVLDNIGAALKRITRNNPNLLIAYYRFYSSDWKLTDDIESSSGKAGNTDQGIKHRKGFTDINAGVLHLQELPQLPTDDPLSLLGSTLIHEYAHTPHAIDASTWLGEGKAYGIENFFDERMGDKKRDEITLILGPKKGDSEAFNASYQVMKQLYEVIDNHSKPPGLSGVSAERAREMSVEFISKNKEDFSDELKRYLLTEIGESAYKRLR